ncbi:hypothetical protein L484_024629 [Morus notabilis]|uniref:Uncharacterized protein n=1 Tax=Morus notabilis TaxID=981085 RepID=W9QRP4_9ROSA|nr:hypothetical protein L484_024629 [Morus notabilis]
MSSAVRGKARASHHRRASETLWLLLLTCKQASPAVRFKKLGFRVSRDNVNAVFYAETYHPIKATSIDGTDFIPHDSAVYHAYLYDPLGDPNLLGGSYSLAALSSSPAVLTNPSNTLRKDSKSQPLPGDLLWNFVSLVSARLVVSVSGFSFF